MFRFYFLKSKVKRVDSIEQRCRLHSEMFRKVGLRQCVAASKSVGGLVAPAADTTSTSGVVSNTTTSVAAQPTISMLRNDATRELKRRISPQERMKPFPTVYLEESTGRSDESSGKGDDLHDQIRDSFPVIKIEMRGSSSSSLTTVVELPLLPSTSLHTIALQTETASATELAATGSFILSRHGVDPNASPETLTTLSSAIETLSSLLNTTRDKEDDEEQQKFLGESFEKIQSSSKASSLTLKKSDLEIAAPLVLDFSRSSSSGEAAESEEQLQGVVKGVKKLLQHQLLEGILISWTARCRHAFGSDGKSGESTAACVRELLALKEKVIQMVTSAAGTLQEERKFVLFTLLRRMYFSLLVEKSKVVFDTLRESRRVGAAAGERSNNQIGTSEEHSIKSLIELFEIKSRTAVAEEDAGDENTSTEAEIFADFCRDFGGSESSSASSSSSNNSIPLTPLNVSQLFNNISKIEHQCTVRFVKLLQQQRTTTSTTGGGKQQQGGGGTLQPPPYESLVIPLMRIMHEKESSSSVPPAALNFNTTMLSALASSGKFDAPPTGFRHALYRSVSVTYTAGGTDHQQQQSGGGGGGVVSKVDYSLGKDSWETLCWALQSPKFKVQYPLDPAVVSASSITLQAARGGRNNNSRQQQQRNANLQGDLTLIKSPKKLQECYPWIKDVFSLRCGEATPELNLVERWRAAFTPSSSNSASNSSSSSSSPLGYVFSNAATMSMAYKRANASIASTFLRYYFGDRAMERVEKKGREREGLSSRGDGDDDSISAEVVADSFVYSDEPWSRLNPMQAVILRTLIKAGEVYQLNKAGCLRAVAFCLEQKLILKPDPALISSFVEEVAQTYDKKSVPEKLVLQLQATQILEKYNQSRNNYNSSSTNRKENGGDATDEGSKAATVAAEDNSHQHTYQVKKSMVVDYLRSLAPISHFWEKLLKTSTLRMKLFNTTAVGVRGGGIGSEIDPKDHRGLSVRVEVDLLRDLIVDPTVSSARSSAVTTVGGEDKAGTSGTTAANNTPTTNNNSIKAVAPAGTHDIDQEQVSAQNPPTILAHDHNFAIVSKPYQYASVADYLDAGGEEGDGDDGNTSAAGDSGGAISSPTTTTTTTSQRSPSFDLTTWYMQQNTSSKRLWRSGRLSRLDLGTGGLVMFGKNDASVSDLASQHQNGQFSKVYMCLCMILGDLNSLQLSGIVEFDDRKTQYEILRFFAEPRIALVACTIGAGAKNQIRRSMASIKAPLVNDVRYGGALVSSPLLKHIALHCTSVSFQHPTTGKRVSVSEDLPGDWDLAISRIEKYEVALKRFHRRKSILAARRLEKKKKLQQSSKGTAGLSQRLLNAAAASAGGAALSSSLEDIPGGVEEGEMVAIEDDDLSYGDDFFGGEDRGEQRDGPTEL